MCARVYAQLWVTLCNPLNCSLPCSSIHGIFPGKNTGVGCHFLLQEHTYYSINICHFIVIIVSHINQYMGLIRFSKYLALSIFSEMLQKGLILYQGRFWDRVHRCTGVYEKSIRRCQRGGPVGLWMNASQS